MTRQLLFFVFGFLVLTAVSTAGVYKGVATEELPLPAIVHPPGFAGGGTALTITVCASAGDLEVVPALQGALAKWDALAPMSGNCPDCWTYEAAMGSNEHGPFCLETLLVHELGHCIMGLGHTNLSLNGEITSFTNTVDATSMSAGGDGVRGSSDDQPIPVGVKIVVA